MVSVLMAVDYGMGMRGRLSMAVPPGKPSMAIGSMAIGSMAIGASLRGNTVDQFASGQPASILEPLSSKYDTNGCQQIGYGKHSEVVTVRGKATGMEYAMKILPLSSVSEANVRREVLAMREFNHRWTANLVDVVQCNERLPFVNLPPPFVCIIMNKINNSESLSKAIRAKGGNPQLALRMLQSLCSALQEMHSRGLVHMDIWSENILVDPAGNCYLIDFGCAESLRRPSGPLRNDGWNIPYLSPQVCKKDLPAPSDDMWALGLTLTELVTGRIIIYRMGQNDCPFYTKVDLLNQAMAETELMGGPALGNIARRLLDPDPNKRATAAEVLGMASSGFSGVPPAAQPAGYQSQSFQPAPQSARPGGTPQASGQAGFGGVMEQYLREAVTGLAPGQHVSYQASSHNLAYKGVVVGRAPNNRAWLIQLVAGGTKEVPDHEAWRLKPSGGPEGPPIPKQPLNTSSVPGLLPKSVSVS